VKVKQVSAQVDNVSVKQAYPTLGQARVVTYNNTLWEKNDKKANDKWVNIFIFPYAVGDFSSQEIENLIGDLRAAGYTPLLGTFGIGGPYSSGFGPLSDNNNVSLYYFAKSAEQMSVDIQKIVLKDLPVKNLGTYFVDAPTMPPDDLRRFVIENSGLDLQLVLRPVPK
jgi:hypothetical protein